MDDQSQHRCPKCGELRDIKLFELNSATLRRNYTCNICKQLKVALPWDWACALKKSTRMHVAKMQGQQGTYFDALDEDMLRALMKAQDYKCALTRVRFHLPTPEDLQALSLDKTGNNSITLTAWKDQLEPHLQRIVPVMARISAEGDWMPGNVVLICHQFKSFYEAVGGMSALRTCCELITKTPLHVPQREYLEQIRQGIAEDNLKQKQRL